MKKIFWSLLVVALIFTMPGIAERVKVEWANDTYEFIIPFEEISSLTEKNTLQVQEVLSRLKSAGLQSVSLEPETLKSLESSGDIITFTPERMREVALFSQGIDSFMTDDHQGIYIYVLKKSAITDKIADVFSDSELQTVHFNDKELLFIPGKRKEIADRPIGFSNEVISAIQAADLAFVPRLPNVGEEEEAEELLFAELLALQNQSSHRLLLSGEEVFGFSNKNKLKSYGQQLQQANYSMYQIDMYNQRGFETLAYSLGMQVIRLHSLDLDKIETETATGQAIRAVKERNIRSLFLRFEKGEPEEVLQKTEQFMTKVSTQMPKQFQLGTVKPFDTYTVPLWSYLCAFVASIAFLTIATLQVFNSKWLAIIAGVGSAIICVAYAILKMGILLKGLALLVAIATPIFALLPLKETNTWKAIFRGYGRAALISFMGIIIIVALLNGNQFLVNVDAFKGVKLLYIAPIIFMCLYALLGYIRKFVRQPIRYWHLAVAIVLAGLVFYYISRTGNAGTASQLELSIRQWLEQVLYARPRTKEFLIGFPFFVLTLFVYPKQRLLGKILLIPSVIGYLSLVNTFTHLHIPLYVSIIRSILGLLLGLVVGLIFIYIYQKITTVYERVLKPRWK